MELVYKGKTKDVYLDENGQTVLYFKDDMTGKDGVFDPGENQVGLKVEGSGKAGLKMTSFFFEKLNSADIPTHYVDSDVEKREMRVKKINIFGEGLEVICRYKAVGSFIRRYSSYIEEGAELPAYVEVTLKDDEKQDPFITKDALEALNILTADEYSEIADLTVKISEVVKEELAQKGLDLYDIKLEFGRDQDTGEVLLIDEISGGNMRVYKDGENIEPLKIVDYLFDNK
ncbi:Phosphoribosylaminoimidazole-succinocarboxamide synthase [Jeotgalicoccus saudimassiliensis]|uniref:Phosphoribosylaminoimidazole-succinocarboxamide synthase n=1 Tax=Jeotgalicoccus saudimassiliensis TaxID=1461582 RepID=A0A078M4E1_9STAP|nr:phosphoribosylaminoimidazolesuccinocarboxamide synthase [Jeotgalicoccus saudimassiliensis]CEA02373.1 Phosphoribosylaminoimidazole-succinocarboxamide synthase [Jeotgalicoccus saudimassiliensis]